MKIYGKIICHFFSETASHKQEDQCFRPSTQIPPKKRNDAADSRKTLEIPVVLPLVPSVLWESRVKRNKPEQKPN